MFKSTPLIFLLLLLGMLLPQYAPAAVAESGPYFNPATGHWYQAIFARGISWREAQAAAAARSFQGLQGYLATMTSAEENAWAVATFPDAVSNDYYLGESSR